VLEAIARERATAEQRLLDAVAMKDVELRYVKTTLDEQSAAAKELDDRCRELESQLEGTLLTVNHLTRVELPAAVHSTRHKERVTREALLNTANAALLSAEAAQAEAQRELAQALAAEENASREREALRQQLSSLRSESATKDGIIRDLTSAKMALQKQATALEKEAEDLRSEAELLRRSTAGGSATVNEWMAKCQALKSELADVSRTAAAESAAQRKELDDMSSGLQTARSMLRDTENRRKSLETDLAEAHRRISELQHELDALAKAKHALEGAVVNLRLEKSGHANASERQRVMRAVGTSAASATPSPVTPSPPARGLTGIGITTSTVDVELALAPSTSSPRGSFSIPNRSPTNKALSPAASIVRRETLRPTPSRPAAEQRDACVECLLLDVPIDRVTVRAATAIGRDTARSDARVRNALLRDELTTLRIVLHLAPTSAEHQYLEHDPIPVTTVAGVDDQNDQLARELQRRRDLARVSMGSASTIAADAASYFATSGSAAAATASARDYTDAAVTSPIAELVKATWSSHPPLTPDDEYSPRGDAQYYTEHRGVEGTIHVPLNILSPRGQRHAPTPAGDTDTLGAGFKRPKSASHSGRHLNWRPQSTFAEHASGLRQREQLAIDPVTYFSVGGRLHSTANLLARGIASRPATAEVTSPRAANHHMDHADGSGSVTGWNKAEGNSPRHDHGTDVNIRMHSRAAGRAVGPGASVTPHPPSFDDVMRRRKDAPGVAPQVRASGAGFRTTARR
jgi:hypothetical protein